jgi:uncharacterized membrane protein YeiH
VFRGFDLAATGLFAVGGARLGAEADLDLFGVLVVAFVSALGGGILRDVLVGDLPPAAFRSVSYELAAVAGAGIVIVWYQLVREIPSGVITPLDAAALGLFCATGTAKGLDVGTNHTLAALLGMITAVGGGVIRDLLLNRVPQVLRVEIYAVAAVVGAAAMVVAVRLEVPRARAMAVGAAVCFTVRMVSVGLDWNLPRVRGA